MSASRRAVATGRRPSCPARHLGRLRPALAAGSGIGLAAIELVRQVVAHEGGEAWLARAGGRPVLLSRMYSEPGPRIAARLPADPPWAAERLVEVFRRGAGLS